jgi:hypothetical protein
MHVNMIVKLRSSGFSAFILTSPSSWHTTLALVLVLVLEKKCEDVGVGVVR